MPFEKDQTQQFNAMMPAINNNKDVSGSSSNKALSEGKGRGWVYPSLSRDKAMLRRQEIESS